MIQGELSLKEMKEAAENVKNKKKVVLVFLKFTGERDWESLQKWFPHHATEQKLAEFKGLLLKGTRPCL